ncbi:hypothetical protein ABZT02_11880 [Streptomyces sp. NPDC005402]|uniref:hypothetical protein n=1 Tax=Streptomyces sp. NPDC005402 TaxID=3155338 RepID=UPI0033AEE566
MSSTCPVAQLFGEAGTEADADGFRPVGLAVGGAEGLAAAAPDEAVGAPVVGVPESLSDGPPDAPPHATRTTTPAVTHPPAHHRIRAPPGQACPDTSMPHPEGS